jgi:hypothetical protein
LRLGCFPLLVSCFPNLNPSCRQDAGAPGGARFQRFGIFGCIPGALPQALELLGLWPAGANWSKGRELVQSPTSKVQSWAPLGGFASWLFSHPAFLVSKLENSDSGGDSAALRPVASAGGDFIASPVETTRSRGRRPWHFLFPRRRRG